jgi:isoquinoline 1-oxidoreductase subunit alpha
MVTLNVNGRSRLIELDKTMPLLWALRDQLHLTGTKFGCGRALCGACTVHVDGEAARSCSIMVGEVEGKTIVTIEGLSGEIATAVQEAWIAAAVPQCGYCQPGFVMAVTSLLGKDRNQNTETVLKQLNNICRCGTYDAIRTAVRLAVNSLKAGASGLREGGR